MDDHIPAVASRSTFSTATEEQMNRQLQLGSPKELFNMRKVVSVRAELALVLCLVEFHPVPPERRAKENPERVRLYPIRTRQTPVDFDLRLFEARIPLRCCFASH